MVLAVDVGYGFTKAVSPAGLRVSWPTTLRRRPAAPQGLTGTLGAPAEGHAVRLRWPDEPEAAHYQIGETGRRAWAAEAAGRAGYDVQVLAAARLLAGRGEVDLLLGLPLALWTQAGQRNALRQRLEGRAAAVGVDREGEAEVTLRSVRVLPQAAGAFQYALQRDPALALKPVGLIDVGYRTTDYLVMRRVAAGLALDEAACGSADLGAGLVYERVRQGLTEQAGVLVPEGAVEDALANYRGRLYLQGREVDAGAPVAAGLRALAAEVAEEVRRAWGDRLALLGAVLVGGGGGQALAPFLTDLHPLTRLMPEPVWANALGFLAMAGAAPTLAATGA